MADETQQPTGGVPTPAPNTGGSSQQGRAMADAKGLLAQLEAFLDEYMIKKAPFQIPMGGKEFIVKVSPYLVIIGAIFLLPVVLLAFGIGTFVTPYAMMGGYTWGFAGIISLAGAVVTILLELWAVSGLFKRTAAAWRLVWYATLVSFVVNVLTMNIIGGIIGAIIGWYILFQVKELYRN